MINIIVQMIDVVLVILKIYVILKYNNNKPTNLSARVNSWVY